MKENSILQGDMQHNDYNLFVGSPACNYFRITENHEIKPEVNRAKQARFFLARKTNLQARFPGFSFSDNTPAHQPHQTSPEQPVKARKKDRKTSPPAARKTGLHFKPIFRRFYPVLVFGYINIFPGYFKRFYPHYKPGKQHIQNKKPEQRKPENGLDRAS